MLLGIKEDNRKLSVPLVIRAARASDEVPPELPLPPSTVHRLLARQGVMGKDPGAPSASDRDHLGRLAGDIALEDAPDLGQ